MMNIYFITGTSGAGKSTLIEHLKKRLPKDQFEIYDFDEVGVPPNADQAWRLKITDYWLLKAKENQKKKKSSIICGVSVPSEVLQSTQNFDIPLYFGFLKVDDTIIRKRLAARDWEQKLIQDNIIWASYLEKEVSNQKNHLIVNGSNTPEAIAETFIDWILLKSTN